MVEIKENTFNEYMINNFINHTSLNYDWPEFDCSVFDINILPVEDWSNGRIGSLLLRQNHHDGSEIVVEAIHDVFNVFKKVKCVDIVKFQKFFELAVRKGYYICKWDDPKTLQVGFIVFKRGKIKIYAIGLNKIKQYTSKFENSLNMAKNPG